MLKRIYQVALGIVVCLGFVACNSNQASSSSTRKDSSAYQIKVPTPPRPSGQKDVLNLTTPKMETVRVGIIGLGMRGHDAVRRLTYVPGAKVTALCDIRPEMVERSQKILEKEGLARVDQYTGSEDA